MLALCSNRPEGFGTVSHLYSNITTSCFNDVILVPLATWIYLIFLMVLFATQRHTTTYIYTGKTKRSCHAVKTTLYGLALFFAFAMTVLEVTRLELAHLGIGLLPFEWAGFIFAGILRFSHGLRGRFPRYWIAGTVFWLLLVITNAVRIAEFVKAGVDTGKGSKYPTSDQIMDVSVYTGVYIVLMFLEGWK